MNRMERIQRRSSFMNRLMQWPLLCGLLCLVLARTALAQSALYENDGIVSYPGTQSYPPQIDATNFINTGSFTINFATLALLQPYYETSDTVNYTNTGLMMANTGFQFDDQSSVSGLRTMSGIFNNSGLVSCGSTNDTGATFFLDYAQCLVSATNIVNPGTVDVGVDGQIQFNGLNDDLSFSTLIMEGEGAGASAAGTGVFGLNTNAWDPSANLGPNFAESAIFPIAPVILVLTNSTTYYEADSSAGGTNVVYRFVFIQDTSASNVSYNVYFNTGNLGFGGGNVTIQWAGTYENVATGNSYTNYFYLNDDYALGASTNVALVNGVPDNFAFTGSTTPQLVGAFPAPPGFPAVDPFVAGGITNLYSFGDIQLIPTTESTNAIANGALTNFLGRIQISATNELNLASAQITGPNYLSVQSPNQFDGSPGALIQAPFSDLNLGVTNGFLTVSNLLTPQIPDWSGTIQAWNTRWLVANALGGTNDFRVLIVGSQLNPTTLAQVQNLILHGTNSIVISDAFNVMNTFSADAQNLTLTTNGVGIGATSLDGELNFGSASILLGTVTPNLRNLTNNGAIRTLNLANFGSSTQPYFNFINNGLVSDQGAAIWADNFVSGGTLSNGISSFALQSLTTTLTNGLLAAGANVSITASSLVTSNLVLQSGRSLTLQVTNLLTDTGVTNGNLWSVGGASSVGLNLPIKPVAGDLLGTTITNIALANTKVANTWAGQDRGASSIGFSNNVAIGQLILDAQGPSPNAQFSFTGTSVSNAIYVDNLVLLGYASYTNRNGETLPALSINTNLVIYYAQATVAGGVTVAEQLNGFNSNHLRWVPTYAGFFSSIKLVYPVGVTNTLNAALAESGDIDSNGNGTPNADDSAPIFVPAEVDFTTTLTNLPPRSIRLQWTTVPLATNIVQYTTNLLSPTWFTLTNFISPQPYPSPTTNVWVFDPATNATPRYYQVLVEPDLLYGETLY